MTSKISPFIEKLQQILSDPSNIQYICFNQANARLQISNKKKLELILPKYFRHGRFESFVRQLNWYGFYKINNKSLNCYSHPDLEEGKQLSTIKSRRKPSAIKSSPDKRTEQNISEPELHPTFAQLSPKNITFFVPFQNNISVQYLPCLNQNYPIEYLKMCLVRNINGIHPIYYPY